MGIVQASISSEEGCRQGCVAGSLLFANTTLPALEAVQKEFPSLVILDDTTLIADENVIFAAYRRLRKLQLVNGCIVQKKKCESQTKASPPLSASLEYSTASSSTDTTLHSPFLALPSAETHLHWNLLQ
jgi:hypothetical protein